MLCRFIEGLLKVCHRVFQGFGPPGEVKLPLHSFWIELLLPPVHHLRVGKGSWLWSVHDGGRVPLPKVAMRFGALNGAHTAIGAYSNRVRAIDLGVNTLCNDCRESTMGTGR